MTDPLILIAAAVLILAVVALATIQPWAHRPKPYIRLTEGTGNRIYGNTFNADQGCGFVLLVEGGEFVIKDCTVHD